MTHIAWKPHPGSQTAFMSCPAFEVLYEGTRGPGKTDALIMDFLQFVDRGYGAAWRGILFRETYPQLDDIVRKCWKWIPRIWPGADFNKQDYCWTFPQGESLSLRHAKRKADYWNYHGHEYPWIGWEELTNWSSPDLYDQMKSVCRSSAKGLPRRYRSTCNPWGKGHAWVKRRFIDPAPPGHPIRCKDGRFRVRIHGELEENPTLLAADPEYINALEAVEDEALRRAWRYGDWDIAAGGMFADIWSRSRHVVPRFQIPSSWRLDRSFDWGSSAPSSVGWWAEADGTEATMPDGQTWCPPAGSLIRVAEWYICDPEHPEKGRKMLASEIARGIREREAEWGWTVWPGPADSAIYTTENGNCIADDMEAEGVEWTRANKSPGSRVNGWELLRSRLSAAAQPRPEYPGIYVCEHCRHWIRTVPTLPRSEKNPDDVDSDAEDHAADETRYRILDSGVGALEALPGVID